MYTTCPKCQYIRQSTDQGPQDICPHCGLVFHKWLKNLADDKVFAEPIVRPRSTSVFKSVLLNIFLPQKADIPRGEFFLYVGIWIVFLAWGIDFILMDFRSNEIGRSWFHNVDLIFHEAGHIVFMPFGRTMTILGGSLFQVIVPFLLMCAFLIQNRDGFAASIGLWWVGQSIMDLAPYIADARALQLPLLGGGTGADGPMRHDWANLLRPRGWLEYDTIIAAWVDFIGSGIILLSLLWGAAMLRKYYKAMVD